MAKYGLPVLGRIVDSEWAGLDPAQMGLGPVHAATPLLKRHGLKLGDIDAWEINEAFAAQVLPSAKHLGIPLAKLNVHGGAIALGHPFGMTGARIMTTLINGLQTDGKRYGLDPARIGAMLSLTGLRAHADDRRDRPGRGVCAR